MSTVTTETEDGVTLITLNRPDALNVFSGQLMDDLAKALITTNTDPRTRVAVLTGAGRAFSAGTHLMEMGQLDALFDFSKPLLLAVNGLGVGIGATISGVADMTFMAKSARLCCPFSSLGLTAEAGRTHRQPGLQQPLTFRTPLPTMLTYRHTGSARG